jgi:tyrosyl-tRNA synthetase
MNYETQLETLAAGAETLHSREDLLKKLRMGRPLRVKFGVDPTAPDIHLGHTVPLFKLRQFQDMGHLAVLIIGDFTARIGDPTGRKSTRPELSPEAIRANAQTYEEQAFKILDRDKTEIVWNGSWFDPMNLSDTIRLLARRPVAQMLQRRDFKERFESAQPIQLHELVYPMLQGWDSVKVRSDVELGGSDQLFNLLTGRDLQEQEGQEPQVVLTLPILEGLDGAQKMSKSLGNFIGVTESPKEMFGKAMSISDELMDRWYRLLPGRERDGAVHPMEAKKQLAGWIVEKFHDAASAVEARAGWERQFSQRETPEEMPSRQLVPGEMLWQLLKNSGLASSGAEARRMIQQGAVSLDGTKLSDPQHVIETPGVLKYGKRHHLRLVS